MGTRNAVPFRRRGHQQSERERETKMSTDRKWTVEVWFELGHVEDIMDVHTVRKKVNHGSDLKWTNSIWSQLS